MINASLTGNVNQTTANNSSFNRLSIYALFPSRFQDNQPSRLYLLVGLVVVPVINTILNSNIEWEKVSSCIRSVIPFLLINVKLT